MLKNLKSLPGIDDNGAIKIAARVVNAKRFATKGEYVPSLKGEGKMSKSIPGSFILLTDDLETIKHFTDYIKNIRTLSAICLILILTSFLRLF